MHVMDPTFFNSSSNDFLGAWNGEIHEALILKVNGWFNLETIYFLNILLSWPFPEKTSQKTGLDFDLTTEKCPSSPTQPILGRLDLTLDMLTGGKWDVWSLALKGPHSRGEPTWLPLTSTERPGGGTKNARSILFRTFRSFALKGSERRHSSCSWWASLWLLAGLHPCIGTWISLEDTMSERLSPDTSEFPPMPSKVFPRSLPTCDAAPSGSGQQRSDWHVPSPSGALP